jgi:hypothetical protein
MESAVAHGQLFPQTRQRLGRLSQRRRRSRALQYRLMLLAIRYLIRIGERNGH